MVEGGDLPEQAYAMISEVFVQLKKQGLYSPEQAQAKADAAAKQAEFEQQSQKIEEERRALQTDKEIGAQLCKCFGVSSDLLQICNYLERDTFNVVASPPTPAAGDYVRTGVFAMGIDLEAFGATSSATRIESGVNSTALQCFINFTTAPGTTFGANYDVHTWANYDMLCTFANGQAYSRF